MSRIKYVIAWALLLWLVALPVMAQSGGDTTILGRDYTLGDGQQLDNDLVVLGGQVHLEEGSTVIGDVTVLGGEAEFAGRVQGDVVILGGTATLGASARIEGDVVVLGQLRRDPDATITGNLVQGAEAGKGLEQLPEALRSLPGVSQVSPSSTAADQNGSGVGRAMANFAALLLVLMVAALGITLVPEHLDRLRHGAFASPLLSLGIGILSLAVVGILIPILVVICIGIPIAIVAGLTLMLGALFGWVAAGQIVGERLATWLKLPLGSPLSQGLVGVLVISLLAQIPCIGPPRRLFGDGHRHRRCGSDSLWHHGLPTPCRSGCECAGRWWPGPHGARPGRAACARVLAGIADQRYTPPGPLWS